jgi:hypothetical protein
MKFGLVGFTVANSAAFFATGSRTRNMALVASVKPLELFFLYGLQNQLHLKYHWCILILQPLV